VARLLEMEIEPYLLSSAMIGVIAQRLVRKICPNCQTNYMPPQELLDRIGWQGRNATFAMGAGCEQCFDSGLRGRTGIYELLETNEELRQVILRDPSADAVRNVAQRNEMRTLRDEAFRLVEEGQTTIDEILRVVFVDERRSRKEEEKVAPNL
jgi:type II secretory ATPase GspE/PulE/Tfp pilus assembly ATPase PilB-like protein